MLIGSALTAPFLHQGLGRVIAVADGAVVDGAATDGAKADGPAAGRAAADWDGLRTGLRGGSARQVHRQVTLKLARALGYARVPRQDPVATREGQEDGGWLMQASNGARLRAWSIDSAADLDAAERSPLAFRVSPTRIAQRVLQSRGERAGLLTNGDVVRLLLCDPSRADSHLTIPLGDWPTRPLPPDSFRLLLALAGASGLPRLPEVLEAARLHQVKVTAELRRQATQAITGFINALPDRSQLDAAALWREALVLVYRLLFILKLESPAEPGAGFSFASARLWRSALSPNQALGPLVRRHLDQGHDTGRMLEAGLRSLFAVFRDGLSCSELRIAPLGGALFGAATTPLLDRIAWGERAVAILLDRLIWIAPNGGERMRVHYGSLDVEDLGSVYEGLLEQEPGIATEPLVRLRRGKREAVVPAAAGAADIEPGAFFLRSGMGRKASGSFYTPNGFVRFLVRETLDPMIAALCPLDDPHPARLLALRIVDPAAGSGHFLVQACRHLAEALLAACRLCDERGLHDRIAALPDPDNSIAAYLPSRGYSEARARAICRRLVAVNCLYGCDRNQLAVELAKLSLWLESYAEGLPLTFLDHRVVQGDALSGPFFRSLATLPVSGGVLDPLLARGVADRLTASLAAARRMVAALNASIGRDVDDLGSKQAVKRQLDRLLSPLRQLARAWAGAAMLRDRDADDVWLGLAAHVAESGEWPDRLDQRQAALLAAGADAVAWDLVFPEVFPNGFSVVLGNPPWDVVLPNTKDFVADFDPRVLDARTRTERTAIEQTVLSRPEVAAAFEAYRAGFDRLKRVADRLYRHQRIRIGSGPTGGSPTGGSPTGGSLDLFRLFAERNMELAAADAAIGVLMPSAFHANEGSSGIRRLYLEQTQLQWCLSFENRRRIFDIDSRFKFDLIVARRPGPTGSLRCGFYLDAIEDAADPGKIMNYTRAFLTLSGGAAQTPLELRGNQDLRLAKAFFARPERLAGWCAEHRIRFGNDLHMTADAALFRPPGGGDLVLHEGKTFHQYSDSWDTLPRYGVAAAGLPTAVARAAGHYRLVFRDIARSNDERTMIACIAPPEVVFGHTATVEKTPWTRPNADALVLCAVFNSFAFDWLVRQKAATHLSLYILNALPMVRFGDAARRFLAHAALLLSCRHPGYHALWHEQVGGARAGPADRPALRARIDAVVADGYGLDRDGYARVLGSFSYRSDPDAAAVCLAAFEAIRAEGVQAFCRHHDPYADVALVTAMAEPVAPRGSADLLFVNDRSA
ncbi:Eco57I restriction-modification methylase domain-containing protein [Rhodopila sp.]|uniref:Eco57I restriction-modification methylase domain-containing protein n=1 Tax=Rhodopila sp. TaxID=2480087 RepID=UPI003D0F0B39